VRGDPEDRARPTAASTIDRAAGLEFSHRRQVPPGDSRRKLTLQTRASWRNQLKDVLDHFGYARA
jgi:hypothetical protein